MTSLSHVQFFATPWTVAYQDSPSMGFSRQENWSGFPFPSPGDLPNPGIEPGLPHCGQTLYHLGHQGSQLTWLGRGLFHNSCLVSCVENTSSLPRDHLQTQTQLNSTSRSFFPFKSVMTPSGCMMLFLRQTWAVNFSGSPACWERCVCGDS